MSSRRKNQQKQKGAEPEEEAREPEVTAPLVNDKAEARKLRKLKKKGLLNTEEEEPAPPDNETVAQQINQEKMASAVSGITQKAMDAADTNSKDVQILGFDMKYKDQSLLEGADLKIIHGRKYGIIGANGTGKSTLLRHIAHKMIPIPKHIQVLYVEQEIDGTETIALDAVVAADTERIALLAEQIELKEKLENLTEDAEDGIQLADRLAEVEDRLIEIRAATAVERASAILSGLQFTPKMKTMMTKEFSGGWRMRIALARALFVVPDLLMLDEPTNHLDLEASIWLEHYLAHFKKTLLLVSHDRDFINGVVTDIINFRDKKLEYYSGNYDQYENLLKAKLAEQRKIWEKEQKLLKELQKKQTPDALNKLEAMKKAGLMAEPKNIYDVRFKFEDVGKLEFPVIQMDKVTFGYDADKTLFTKLSAYLDCESRIAIVGPNGSGKSTLMKLLTGDLKADTGEVRLNRHLRIAKFSQHFMDQLTMEETPLSFITKKIREQSVNTAGFEKANEEERQKPPEDRAKTMLCRFNLKHELFNKPIALLSGGQKCRVALCDVAVQRPHIFFLDEPTNHLDMKSVDALLNGLKSFPGGIVIITHDQRLVTSLANQLWICRGDQKIEVWHLDGVEHSFDDYRQEIFDQIPEDLFEDDDDDGEAERERKQKYKQDRQKQQGKGKQVGGKGGKGPQGGKGQAGGKGGKQQPQKGGPAARGGKAARGKK